MSTRASEMQQYGHAVGYFGALGAAIIDRVPRALCGASLEVQPGEPVPSPDAQLCPDCQERMSKRALQRIGVNQ